MKFVINKDKVKIENNNTTNSGSINYYEADVIYDNSWNDLTIKAIIIDKQTSNSTPIGIEKGVINNQLLIDKDIQGIYYIGFVGYKIENEEKIYQISTNLVPLKINQGAGEIEAVNDENIPTPSEWEVYMAQVQMFIDNGQDIIDEANTLDVDNDGEILTITKKDGSQKQVNVKGDKGTDGADGISPIANVEQISDGAIISITDKSGTTTANVMNGANGQDGYSPVKGIDYWTNNDKIEVVSSAVSQVETDIEPTLNNIESIANTANNTANTAKSIAEGANQALSYGNYQTMITAFNALDDDVYRIGQNMYILTLNVPDLWISSIEQTSIPYIYTTDENFINELETNGFIQVGYYRLSALETQKVDLTNYVEKTDVATGRYDQGNGGIVGVTDGNGISVSSGNLYIVKANDSMIDAEVNNYRPLVSSNYRRAVNRVINNRFVTLTQAEYDALVSGGTVDANTYYLIKE